MTTLPSSAKVHTNASQYLGANNENFLVYNKDLKGVGKMSFHWQSVVKLIKLSQGLYTFCYWSERHCADGFVETAVGLYFWYFGPSGAVQTVSSKQP